MDAGKFYALLRFEEASLALRAVMRMGIVDRLGDQYWRKEDVREILDLTRQAARTFLPLLEVMEILEVTDKGYRVTPRAAQCLADGIAASRKPYLAMGTDAQVDVLIDLLRGRVSKGAVPLYGDERAGDTLMDDHDVAREIAFGLSARARNFAEPLADAIAGHATDAKILADIGAGSPYVAQACLRAVPNLEQAILVDRDNALRFTREMIAKEHLDADRLAFHNQDFFQRVPAADIYVLSNTAHDWRKEDYSRIIGNVREQISTDGMLCIHEPLLMKTWHSDAEWIHALWMACYALTLFRLTLGQGTCYSADEHHEILAHSGFVPLAEPVATCDGCTALFYSN